MKPTEVKIKASIKLYLDLEKIILLNKIYSKYVMNIKLKNVVSDLKLIRKSITLSKDFRDTYLLIGGLVADPQDLVVIVDNVLLA